MSLCGCKTRVIWCPLPSKQHSAYAWVVTCILFLINLTFHNLPLHSSYKIHQPFTDYFLRLPYSELLEKRLFRSRANRRLVSKAGNWEIVKEMLQQSWVSEWDGWQELQRNITEKMCMHTATRLCDIAMQNKCASSTSFPSSSSSYAGAPRLTMRHLIYRTCIVQSAQAASALIAINVGSGKEQNSFASGAFVEAYRRPWRPCKHGKRCNKHAKAPQIGTTYSRLSCCEPPHLPGTVVVRCPLTRRRLWLQWPYHIFKIPTSSKNLQ